MLARDFIDEKLLPWLAEEIGADASGNKHYVQIQGCVQSDIPIHRAASSRVGCAGANATKTK